MIWLAIIITLAGVGYFAWRKRKAARREGKLEVAAGRLKAGLDNPEIDEGFAHEVVARARDKGAV